MLDELFSGRDEGNGGGLFEAIVATDPDGDGRVMVVVPSVDPRLREGPCPVMPRGSSMPIRGDRCLVAFSDEDRPWVVAWEPSSILPNP